MKSAARTQLNYLVGFVSSVILTLVAYGLVQRHLATNHVWPTDAVMVVALVGIALVQLFAQMTLFLHVGDESKPRLKLMATLFAGLVVLVVVIGSLWIMHNLNYHMGTPSSVDSSIIKDEGIHR